MYIATFFKLENGNWHFIVKLYRADYESEARDNAERDRDNNYSGWLMDFKRIPYFDQFNSTVIVEFSK